MCDLQLEKALHEMRAEAAETKVAAESKLAEAHTMEEEATKKLTEADTKLHAAEALEVDANRFHRTAERKIQEVEAREDDLRRRILTFKSEYVPQYHVLKTKIYIRSLTLSETYYFPL